MKKLLIAAAAVACVTPAATGQNEFQGSYQEFRQKILSDYQDFRNTILSHYADFLEGTWHEYEPLEPLKKSDKPKPAKAPDVKLRKPSPKPVDLPDPKLATKPELKDTPLAKSKVPVNKPSAIPSDGPSLFDTPKVEVPPEGGAAIK